MSTWSTRAAVRGTGPPWSSRNLDALRMSSRSPSDCSSAVSSSSSPPPPTQSMDLLSQPGTPVSKIDWLQECQLSSHGDLTVTERLGTLLDTGQFADVTIRVGQGSDYTTFKAHRLLLATASQPLYRLVSTVQYGHADLNTFRVTDVDPNAFKNVLKFIYTDNISIGSVVEAFSLLKAGKKWNLKKMNVRTLKYLEGFLDDFVPSTEENKNDLFDLLLLAESQSNDLFEKCLNIVIEHAKNIIPCQGFLRLDEKTIRRLLGHPKFEFEDHLSLFEAIRDWGMNQILLKGLSPTQLHPIIEDLLSHVDFAQIKDNDFMGTILPSECLGRAEVIAFFMTRGMEIPRDMGFNNNKQETSVMKNGEIQDFKKVCRFKKGYRLPHKEIYQEHELRFRTDKNIKLLGVGFGFLFSNTDMGVTLHCQGPWERVQWTDMAQTYCRVSWEKMRSADLRLMFAEPAKLEADHSYKVMVRVTRMTSGSTDVELWGGKDALTSIDAEDAKFWFIKAAVDPKKEVDPRETDNKQGMITELLYITDDSPAPTVEETPIRRRRPEPEPEEVKPQEEIVSRSFVRKRSLVTEDEPAGISNLARRRDAGGTYLRWQHPALSTSTDSTRSSYTTTTKDKSPDPKVTERPSDLSSSSSYYARKRPSLTGDSGTRSAYASKDKSPDPKKTETSSYYTRKRPSPVRESRFVDTPSYLKPRSTTTTTTAIERFKETPSFLKSKTTETNASDSPWGERRSRASTRTSGTPSWASTRSTTTTNTPEVTTTSSRYGRDTTSSTTTSRYGRDSSANKDLSSTPSSTTTSRYGRDSSTTKDSSTSSLITSRYGRDSSANKDSSPSYRRDSLTGSSSRRESLLGSSSRRESLTGSSATDSATTPGSSLYRSNSTIARIARDSSASRYGSLYGRDRSASRYGTSYGSSYGTSTGSTYGSSSTGSTYGSGTTGTSGYSSSRLSGSSYSRYR